MALNFRQRLFYRQTFDVWRLTPVAVGTGPVAKTRKDRASYTQIYTDLRGRNQSTRYNTLIGGAGRLDDPNFLTRNDFHFDQTTDIRDNDVLVWTGNCDSSGTITRFTFDDRTCCFRCVGQGELRVSAVANYVEMDTIRFTIKNTANIARVGIYP